MNRNLRQWGLILLLFVTAPGCASAIIAGGAGGYKAATDERTVGKMWDDGKITTKIHNALKEDPVVSAPNVDVDTLNGIVVLTGLVATTRESKRAGEIARKVPGVKKVKNQLQIGSRTWGETLDDKLIGSKIKAKLIKEPGIRSLNIDVDVNKGVVYLTGIVRNRNQKDRVKKIARTTSGVIKVVDNLQMKKPKS